MDRNCVRQSRTGGKPDKAKQFSAFELDKAAEFAESKNKAGFNIYVGAALRHGKTPASQMAEAAGRMSSWLPMHGPTSTRTGTAARIDAILKEKNLSPSMTVVTGQTPHLRAHLYFKLAGRVTPEELERANAALKICSAAMTFRTPPA